jgi:cobalamin synthase
LKESVRVVLIRLMLILATLVSVMGYNFTRNLLFIPLSLLAGIVLVILVRRAPVHDPEAMYTRARARRNGFFQLVVSCAMLAGFLVVSSVRHWGRRDVIGFWIMLSQLVVLAVLAYIWYRRHDAAERRAAEEGDLTCEAVRRSTRIHPD